MPGDSNDAPELTANLVAEHYQHTYELTFEFWKQRNRLFVFLLLTIGLSTIFTLEDFDDQNAILKLIVDIVGAESGSQITELSDSFAMAFLQTILLIIVFFLMFNLYHRSVTVLRNYQYLGQVEDELREILKIGAILNEDAVVYTREGKFYWNWREISESSTNKLRMRIGGLGQDWAKGVYIFLVAVLLIPFLYLSLKSDFARVPAGNLFSTQEGVIAVLVLLIDIVIALLTLVYFLSYSFAAVKLDSDGINSEEALPVDNSFDDGLNEDDQAIEEN